jgi:hypothetical protein
MPEPIPPTAEDLVRDLAADLALCEAATRGPWDLLDSRKERWHFTAPNGHGPPEGTVQWQILGGQPKGSGSRDYGYAVMGGRHGPGVIKPEHADLLLAALSREGWPVAIRRAIAAEARVKELEAEVERLRAEVERLSHAVVEGLEDDGR